MSIDVQQLSFKYDEILVLEKVSLKVKAGEFLGIFGPNGGGKTTFLQLLTGCLKPLDGTILLNGQEPEKMRPRLGYVPQIQRFDKQFPLSVFDLVLQGCLSELRWWGGFPKSAKLQAKLALERVSLWHKQADAFGTLSGGEMQRALIARALASNPQILLLDEATAHVDYATQRQIYQLLLSLKGQMTILMVTHDLQTIVKQTNRLICINRDLTSYAAEEVCRHYSIGLYHPKE